MIYLHVVHFHSTVLDVYFYTYESTTMYFYKLQVHCTFDVTKVEHSCELIEVLHIAHFHSSVLDVFYYTYESTTMYFYKLQVHCTIDVTKVEHSCDRS